MGWNHQLTSSRIYETLTRNVDELRTPINTSEPIQYQSPNRYAKTSQICDGKEIYWYWIYCDTPWQNRLLERSVWHSLDMEPWKCFFKSTTSGPCEVSPEKIWKLWMTHLFVFFFEFPENKMEWIAVSFEGSLVRMGWGKTTSVPSIHYNYSMWHQMWQGRNSHDFHIFWLMVINPIVGVYIPIIRRFPIKGGMTIPNIRSLDPGTNRNIRCCWRTSSVCF